MNLYKCDTTYFDIIDSPDKAYWIGFLLADGGVYKGQLWINLSKKDEVHLEAFRKSLNSTHPIKEKHRCVSYYIRSKRLVYALQKYGIIERKTFNTKFPNHIPKKYVRDFIRGYFDGDGSIKFNKKRNTKVFKLTGTLVLLSSIQDILISKLGLPKNKILRSGNSYVLNYGGNNQVTTIYHYLYDDSNLYLERKHSKFIEFEELVQFNKQRRRQLMIADVRKGKPVKTAAFFPADKYLSL